MEIKLEVRENNFASVIINNDAYAVGYVSNPLTKEDIDGIFEEISYTVSKIMDEFFDEEERSFRRIADLEFQINAMELNAKRQDDYILVLKQQLKDKEYE